jgi:hypothetical protein
MATAVVGTDRYDTGAKVATQFVNPPTAFGVASGANFPDALARGATMGLVDGPLLLTDPTTLPAATQAYVTPTTARSALLAPGSSAAPPRCLATFKPPSPGRLARHTDG